MATIVIRRPGRQEEQTIVLEGSELVIGRELECDITVDDRTVSRRHALLRQLPGGRKPTQHRMQNRRTAPG